MSLPEFSVKNPVLVNMIMIIVFLFGIYTVKNIPKEEMPAVDFGAFYIITNYRGVSPQEIEQQITKKIEDQIGNIEGIDYISSTSREGRSSIYIQMLPNADIDKAWDDINTAIQKVTDLPDDASTPSVIRLNMKEVNSICTISMGGNFSGNTLRELADNFKDELLDIPYISKVEVSGTRDRQIWIDVDPATSPILTALPYLSDLIIRFDIWFKEVNSPVVLTIISDFPYVTVPPGILRFVDLIVLIMSFKVSP